MRQKVKKIAKYFFAFVLISLSLSIATVLANETRDINTAPGELIIPFEKRWSDRVKVEDKKPVTITLYKYLGEFNKETAIKVETVIVNYDEDPLKSWKFNFDISKEVLMDENNNHYKFKIVEEPIVGYKEVQHIDPEVEFKPPTIGENYKRYDTNKTKKIPLTDIGETKDTRFIVGTLTQANNPNTCISGRCDFVVWSEVSLSEGERKLIAKTIASSNLGAQYNSMTYEATYFISGTGEFGGMTVDKNEINFNEKSNWQHIAGGSYVKSSAEANSSIITNDIETIDIVVEKIWDDFNDKYGFRPQSVTVILIVGDKEIETIELNKENNWSYKWEDLPRYDNNGNLIKYMIKEVSVPNYDEPIYSESDNKFTITNKLKKIPVSVKKKWENVGMFEKLPNVLIKLSYCKPTEDNNNCKSEDSVWIEVGQQVELNEANDWYYIWDALPYGLVYKVKEVGFTGIEDADFLFENMFDITYGIDNNNDNNFVITNTYKGSPELPETGSKNALIMIIVSILLLGIPIIYLVYTFTKKSI